MTEATVTQDLGADWQNKEQLEGYGDGTTNDLPQQIKVEGNVIQVVYTKNSYPYTVEYYKDSVDPSNKLGETVTGPAHEYASELTEAIVTKDLEADWLNKEQLFGYGSGVTMDLPQNIKVNGNVIRVVYEIDAGQQKDLSYTCLLYTSWGKQ